MISAIYNYHIRCKVTWDQFACELVLYELNCLDTLYFELMWYIIHFYKYRLIAVDTISAKKKKNLRCKSKLYS